MLMCVVDYGVGNLRSIVRGLEKAGASAKLTRDAKELSDADAIVLPGVGAFKDAMENLASLKNTLLDEIKSGKPLLGICLGLQLLFTESTEGGLHKGLDVVNGKVVRLPSNVKVPHIGWNTIKLHDHSISLFEGITDESYFYFVHSYYAVPKDENVVAARTRYGVSFPSVIRKGNVFATQFHPEKSGRIGLKLLRNFVQMVKEGF
ncbi:MAG: imidazole glycerol phosphate synthase subunit HisH [Candidatus Freyarchaeota archaeon]